MTETLYESVAPLRNVSALMTLIDRVQHRAFGLPGMATFYGPSGFGKSTAAVYATNAFRACHVEVQPLWRSKQLLAGIAFELGLRPARTAADIFEQVSRELSVNQRPLLIDEADRLIRDDMVEVVRGLYEASAVPVILIGEEELPVKLMRWERVHGRMLDWVAAQPADLSDVTQLAPIYASGITLGDDLKARLLEQSSGSHRRVSTNLSHVKETALTLGLTTVGLKDWGARAFFRGEAPPPRREHAVERSRQQAAARTARRG
ncbi:ATP-binding protein [Cereibacter changlensis]|uniref:ATP-binding protein n=2 Tax=Cereibacter changlensis TaxID=402884 RepID=A0A2T4JQS8_9RHOB|nr:ATP-binding protein [Cereibacter changlensis]PTE20248.1 ATP-binding protein [Cereibacter changlensis JA139]PZX47751.1 AAA domain-containing protein [Cereibacter changlensis]TKA96884.1 ATP-binding protein [Cereibacter changlensis]